MQGSKPSLSRIVKWYSSGGLFDPLSFGLAFLVLLALSNALTQKLEFFRVQWLWITLDSLLWPLYALQAAMHVIRDEKTTVFELNLVGSPWRIAFGRIIVFLLSQLVLGASIVGLSLALGRIVPLEAVLVKIVVFATATTLAIPLMSRRASFFLLIAFLVLLPFSSPILVNTSIESGSRKLDPLTGFTALFFSPTYMYYNRSLLPFDYAVGVLWSLILAVLLSLVSLVLFAEAEYSV